MSKIQLTIEKLTAATNQLEPEERAKLVRALAKTDLDTELTQLITEMYNQPPVDDISDADILAEIQAVREH
jgi:hypothetical protein